MNINSILRYASSFYSFAIAELDSVSQDLAYTVAAKIANDEIYNGFSNNNKARVIKKLSDVHLKKYDTGSTYKLAAHVYNKYVLSALMTIDPSIRTRFVIEVMKTLYKDIDLSHREITAHNSFELEKLAEDEAKIFRFRRTISNKDLNSKLKEFIDLATSSNYLDYFDYDNEGQLILYTRVYRQKDGTLADRPDPDFSDENDF